MLQTCISEFVPGCEQERRDQAAMLHLLETQNNLLTRDNTEAHFTVSAWIVNRDRSKTVMVYHNIYRSWSWCGGHTDGNPDFPSVAKKEAQEETGLRQLRLVSDRPLSLEILHVAAHVKRGKPVDAHRHLNLTYLLEADESEPLCVKPDENSAVAWVPVEEVVACSTEPDMQVIYQKLLDKVPAFPDTAGC